MNARIPVVCHIASIDDWTTAWLSPPAADKIALYSSRRFFRYTEQEVAPVDPSAASVCSTARSLIVDAGTDASSEIV